MFYNKKKKTRKTILVLQKLWYAPRAKWAFLDRVWSFFCNTRRLQVRFASRRRVLQLHEVKKPTSKNFVITNIVSRRKKKKKKTIFYDAHIAHVVVKVLNNMIEF